MRDLADRYAHTAGDAAIQLHVELRLLSLCREPDVDRSRHAAYFLLHHLRRLIERHEIVAAQLHLELLSAAPEIAREYRQRDTRHALRFFAQHVRELLGADRTLVLRHEPDVDVSLVDRADGTAA